MDQPRRRSLPRHRGRDLRRPRKVKFVPLQSKDRFVTLQSGEIDVLIRTSTWTPVRDTLFGLNFAGINYFGGEGFMVRKQLGIETALKLGGA